MLRRALLLHMFGVTLHTNLHGSIVVVFCTYLWGCLELDVVVRMVMVRR